VPFLAAAACTEPARTRVLCRDAERAGFVWLFEFDTLGDGVSLMPSAPDAKLRKGRFTRTEAHYNLRFDPVAESLFGMDVTLDRFDIHGVITIGGETQGPIVRRLSCEADGTPKF
jgi:hypothetical protein